MAFFHFPSLPEAQAALAEFGFKPARITPRGFSPEAIYLVSHDRAAMIYSHNGEVFAGTWLPSDLQSKAFLRANSETERST